MAGRYDEERVWRIRAALENSGLDAVVCTLPENVLLLSGYWPVVGKALALATRQGRIAVIAPEDEQDLAEAGWADDIRTFRLVSLDAILGIDEVLRGPIEALARDLGLRCGAIGCEGGPASEPASYAGMFLYGPILEVLLARTMLPSRLESAGPILERLRAAKTPCEVARIRTACRIAGRAFRSGAAAWRRPAGDRGGGPLPRPALHSRHGLRGGRAGRRLRVVHVGAERRRGGGRLRPVAGQAAPSR